MTRRSSRRTFLRTLTGSAMGLAVGNGAAAVFAQAPRAPTNVRVGLASVGGIAITAVSGTLTHGSPVTITGSGFGTKPAAAPLIWDDCSGTVVTDKWSGAWPNALGAPYDLAYRTPIRGVAPPHPYVGRYLAGCANGEGGYNAGWNVLVYTCMQNVPKPINMYFSWYERADPQWVFNIGSPPDNNFKRGNWCDGPMAYDGTGFYWMSVGPDDATTDILVPWTVNPLGSGLNGGSTLWGPSTGPNQGSNPMMEWTKVEILARFSSSSDGVFRIIDDGLIPIDFRGVTETMPAGQRTLTIGGYVRGRNPNNWRYFADLYVDFGWSRVILGNASTLAASTVREVQPPVAWSDNRVTVTLNRGAFSAGAGAYLFVVDGTDKPSPGYHVTLP